MSHEGSSHPGPDESIKRQNAELLQADVADLVLLLVGAHMKSILKHLHITLPPDIGRHINQLASVYGTMMDWATEAAQERTGLPQPRRSAGEAVPVFDFKRLNELGHQGIRARAALAGAWRTVGEAAWQLAAISPDDPAGQVEARRVLGAAIKEFIAASARLMQLDAEDRAARIRAVRIQAYGHELTGTPTAGVVKGPFGPTVPMGTLKWDVRPQLTKQRLGNPALGPAPSQGRPGAAPSL